MQQIISTAHSGDLIAAYPVTANSQATSFEGFEFQVPPPYNPIQENEVQYKKTQQRFTATALKKSHDLIALHETDTGTDLFFSFVKAAAYFNGNVYGHAREKDLIVMTDGMEQTPEYDFGSLELTDTRIHHIIGSLRDDGRLPNLHGVRVWMVGGGADPHGQITPLKIDQVRRFWLAYFQACHANLSPERYGTTLQNYDQQS